MKRSQLFWLLCSSLVSNYACAEGNHTFGPISFSSTPTFPASFTEGTSYDYSYTLSNNAPSTSIPLALSITSTTGSVTLQSLGTCAQPLAGGQSCSFTINIMPNAADVTATKVVAAVNATYNIRSKPYTISSPISVTAVAAPPSVVWTVVGRQYMGTSTPIILQSIDDGTNWTQVTDSGTTTTATLNATTGGNGKRLIGGDLDSSTIQFFYNLSSSWATMSTGSMPGLPSVKHLGYGNEYYLAIVQNSTSGKQEVWSSTNTTTWTNTPLDLTDTSTNANLFGVKYANSQYVIVTNNGQSNANVYYTASPTSSWTSDILAIPNSSNFFTSDFAGGNGEWVAVGASNVTHPQIYAASATSLNSWSEVYLNTGKSANIATVTYGTVSSGTSEFIAIDGSGQTYISTTGTSWSLGTQIPSFQANTANTLAYSNTDHTFVAVGQDNSGVAKIVYSTDGISWSTAHLPSGTTTNTYFAGVAPSN